MGAAIFGEEKSNPEKNLIKKKLWNKKGTRRRRGSCLQRNALLIKVEVNAELRKDASREEK